MVDKTMRYNSWAVEASFILSSLACGYLGVLFGILGNLLGLVASALINRKVLAGRRLSNIHSVLVFLPLWILGTGCFAIIGESMSNPQLAIGHFNLALVCIFMAYMGAPKIKLTTKDIAASQVDDPLSKRKSFQAELGEDKYFAQALEELETDKTDKAAMAQAIVAASDQQEKLYSEYIKIRVAQLERLDKWLVSK